MQAADPGTMMRMIATDATDATDLAGQVASRVRARDASGNKVLQNKSSALWWANYLGAPHAFRLVNLVND